MQPISKNHLPGRHSPTQTIGSSLDKQIYILLGTNEFTHNLKIVCVASLGLRAAVLIKLVRNAQAPTMYCFGSVPTVAQTCKIVLIGERH